MPGQGRLKDRLTNKLDHLLHSLVPRRRRPPSPNRLIEPTLDSQAPVGPDPTSNPDTQPVNSPSLSNIYPSIFIKPAGDDASGRMADLASAGFQGVKATLRLIESVSGVLPPLKSAVSGLLAVIDILEVRDFQPSVVTGWC